MELVFVIVIIFVAFVIRATLGFGDALIAMPLLVMIVGVQVAAPLMAALALVIALLLFVRHRKQVNIQITWKLILSALAGIPVGIFYLSRINESVVSLILGVIIIAFVVYRWSGLKLGTKTPEPVIWLVGFFSGILGAAYNTNGPPIIMLLSSQKQNPTTFRATLQSYFFFTGIGVVAAHVAWGNFSSQVIYFFLVSLPAVALAFFLGEKIFAAFKTQKFYTLVYVLLLIVGSSLIVKALAFPRP